MATISTRCCVLALLATLTACGEPNEQGRAAPERLHPAPEVSWKQVHLSQELSIGKNGKVEFFCCRDDGTMSVDFKGQDMHLYRVVVADRELRLEQQNAPGHFSVPVDSSIGPIPLESLKNAERALPEPFEIVLPITITTFVEGIQRSEVATTEMRGSFGPAHAIAGTLSRAATGPVPLGATDDAEPTDAAIAIWDTPYFSVHHRPTAKQLSDVDWVVLPRWQATGKTRPCGGYDRGGTLEFALESVDLEVYDRRTGKKVSSKSFPPAPGCPTVVTRSPGEKLALGPDRTAMKAWIDASVGKGGFPKPAPSSP